jgi:hypothetical protein
MEKQLQDLADTILFEDLPLDNNFLTDEEDEDDDNIEDYFENIISPRHFARANGNEPSTLSAHNSGIMETQFPCATSTRNEKLGELEAEELQKEPKEPEEKPEELEEQK